MNGSLFLLIPGEVVWIAFTLIHAVGYACILGFAWLLVAPSTSALRARARFIHRVRRTAKGRLERIARLELASKVGLYYGRDFVLSQPIAVTEDYMLALAKDGNGAVERRCWGCEKVFRPHTEYKHWYRSDPDDRELTLRLCSGCFAGAVCELERL